MDKVAGLIEVGLKDDTHQIMITHPDMKPDISCVSNIVLSPRHARHSASLLVMLAEEVEAVTQIPTQL